MLDSEIEEVRKQHPHLSDNFIAGLTKESGNALFGAFNSGTWLLCPGSVQAGFGKTEKTTMTDIENQAMKYWLGKVVTNSFDLGTNLSRQEYRSTINGAEVLIGLNPDMHNMLLFYFDYVQHLITENTICFDRFKIDLSVFAPGGFDYVDAAIYNPDNKTLTVLSADINSEVELNAEESHALSTCAAGAYDNLSMQHDIKFIAVVILQAKLNHISEHLYTADEIEEYSSSLPGLAQDALTVDPLFSPGVTQCNSCPIRTECKPRINWALMHALEDCTNIDETPTFDQALSVTSKITTDKNISSVAHVLPAIEKFITEAHAVITDKLSSGADVPALKMIRGKAGRYWEDEYSVIDYLENVEGLDIDKFAPRKMLSVSDFEKAFPNSDAVAMFEKCKYGNDRLVPIDHPGDDLYRDQFDNLNDKGGDDTDLSFLE